MELKTKHYIGIILGFLVVFIDFLMFFDFSLIEAKEWYFSPILVIGIFLGAIFFIIDVINEGKRQKEIEFKFLEFVRSLVENVRSGVTIPQAILHVRESDLGSLSPYIKKLANQIEWGYPLHDALTIFAKDTKNEVVKRSVAIVIEAEKSGGDMGAVLEAVTSSVFEVKKIKDERKSNAYTQIIQGYIVYFVFLIIMIVLQVYLIPKISVITGDIGSGLGPVVGGSFGGGSSSDISFKNLFLAAIIVQGLFAGLLLGKFAEGDYRSGIKHSLMMVVGGYLVSTTAAGILEDKAALVLLIPIKLILKWKKEE